MSRLVIVGCGNPVRSDDGVGPRLIRYLWERGLPPHVKLVDGGTSGIDVIFHMEGAEQVIFVDACSTGSEPGTVFQVPQSDIEELPSNEEANLHSIKWYHAIALAKHLLNGKYPKNVDIYLIEGKNFSIGEDLSPEVEAAMKDLAEYIVKRYCIEMRNVFEVILNEDGYLIIPGQVAERYFNSSISVIVVPQGMQFTIIPMANDTQGGLLLKRINKEGDRAVLLWELLPPGVPAGPKKAVWEEDKGGLVVSLV